MGGDVVVVLDPERAVADALAFALSGAIPEFEITTDTVEGAAVIVATWPTLVTTARRVLLLPATASATDPRAASATNPDALISRGESIRLVAHAVRLVLAGATLVSPAVTRLLDVPAPKSAVFTAAERRLLVELAERPDTRSRLAQRLGITTSTLDNHVAAVKRKVLSELLTSANAPADGYLSMEALIGWATRQSFVQKT